MNRLNITSKLLQHTAQHAQWNAATDTVTSC